MDELEISGKKYISSKRAGREHKYHPDYIGQLVRAGKVDGQKVGRAWYVEADSLSRYLSQDLGPRGLVEKVVQQVEPVPAPVQEKIVAAQVVTHRVEEIVEKNVEVEDEVVVDSEQKNIVEEIQEEKIPVRSEYTYIPVKAAKPKTGGLTYIEDDGPLFPAIKKGAIPMTTISPMRIDRAPAVEKEFQPQTYRLLARPNQSPKGKGNRIARLGFIVILGAVSFGLALGASYALGGVLTLQGENVTAGVSFVNLK